MVVALPIIVALSPILIARRLIFGPMKCKCRDRCAKSKSGANGETVTVDGEALEASSMTHAEKTDKL